MTSDEPAVLTVWTVYRHPTDHPGKWVLRGFDVRGGSVQAQADCSVADSLEEIHARLPGGLVRLPRTLDDDPAIYESWV
jgi:hypothetical protein